MPFCPPQRAMPFDRFCGTISILPKASKVSQNICQTTLSKFADICSKSIDPSSHPSVHIFHSLVLCWTTLTPSVAIYISICVFIYVLPSKFNKWDHKIDHKWSFLNTPHAVESNRLNWILIGREGRQTDGRTNWRTPTKPHIQVNDTYYHQSRIDG